MELKRNHFCRPNSKEEWLMVIKLFIDNGYETFSTYEEYRDRECIYQSWDCLHWSYSSECLSACKECYEYDEELTVSEFLYLAGINVNKFYFKKEVNTFSF